MYVKEKQCRKCGLVRSASEFYSCKHTRDRLQSWCKSCTRAIPKKPYDKTKQAEAHRRNQEKHQGWAAQQYQVTKKQCRKCEKTKSATEFYREKRNSDGLKSYCKTCCRKLSNDHPNKRIRQAKYRQDNLEKCKQWTADWAKKNSDRMREHTSAYRVRKLEVQTVEFTVAQLRQRWSYYGDKCWLCGEPATATDHVKPLAKGGAHMLANLRPICGSCNSRKRDKWPLLVALWKSSA